VLSQRRAIQIAQVRRMSPHFCSLTPTDMGRTIAEEFQRDARIDEQASP